MEERTRILLDLVGIAVSVLLGATAIAGAVVGAWNALGTVLSIFAINVAVIVVGLGRDGTLAYVRGVLAGRRHGTR